MINERVTFTGAQGHELSARLSLPPDDAPVACALFAHCFTCSKDLKPVVNISRALTQRRIAVFRFDFTGLGESEGDFAGTTFSSNVADLEAAAEHMAREVAEPALLVGHSLGGAAVLRAAERIDSVQAVATIGAPFDPAHVKNLLEGDLDEIREKGRAEIELAGRRISVGREFVEDLATHRMEEAIGGLGRPLAVFHSPLDEVVGIENAALIYKAARHPKSFVSLDDADHLLLDEADSLYVGAVLAAWAGRYLPDADAPEEEARKDAPRDKRVTVRTGPDALRTEVLARGHALLVDEPKSVGGEGLGPTPYDLVAAGLGACTTMTLRMYADRKEWPLEEAVVRLKHTREHRADGEACEDEARCLDRLEREIVLHGDLDEGQRARLLEIADRCPVHRTLEAGVRVTTREGDPARDPG